MTILIVRLGALGDIVHTVPAAAALRRTFPTARIDWLMDVRHAAFGDLVTGIDRVIRLERQSPGGWLTAVRALRSVRYDVALDFQGLLKSAVLARASGARRVIGFSIWHLREKSARPFYSEVDGPPAGAHVIQKNLQLAGALGVPGAGVEFPLERVASAARDLVVREASGQPIALLNPGAAWPNKRWPPARYGGIGVFLRDVYGMQPCVLWGPGEEPLAREVVAASGGAARLAPPTNTADLLALSREAALMVSGDTGPLHIAGAVGTPLVAIFGPTDPARNGPWHEADVVVSRHAVCRCPYQRRCRGSSWCLRDVQVSEVSAAIQQRLDAARRG